MDKHILKASKMAKKALGLFESAISGLENANGLLLEGSQKAEFEIADLLQDKARLEEKMSFAGKRIKAHKEEYNKNILKIQKIKEIFGE